MTAPSGELEVFVRIRPTTNFAGGLIQCLPDGKTLIINHRRDSRKPLDSRKAQVNSWSFRLQAVLQDVSQEEAYERVCRQVVQGALDGYNGTVLCFGQTGAGKTFTMTGSTESYEQRGFIPRAIKEVFQEAERRTLYSFSVHLSYLEIYNETLLDLLSAQQGSSPPCAQGMVVMEEPGRGVFVRGLSLHRVHREEEALDLLFEGEMNRITGSHVMNRNSSRSHCIFTVHIESRLRTLSDVRYVTSKLSLVDLAGSERLGKTGSEGQMLKEANYINKSLSFLEQAILALGDRRRDHVPFRQSKLTHALKDSLGGKCKTVLVANIYGDASHIEETLSTLRFATRMKNVKLEPAVNERVDPALQIKKLEKQVQLLTEELSCSNSLVKSIQHQPLSEAQMAEIHRQVQSYLDGNLNEISVINNRQVQAAFAQFKLAVHHSKGQGEGSQLSRKHGESSLKSKLNLVETSEGVTEEPVTLEPQPPEPWSPECPPTKAEAFEYFKRGGGRDMNVMIRKNKALLQERGGRLQQLSKEFSQVSAQIDSLMAQIQTHRKERRAPVCEDKTDAALMLQLRDLTSVYLQRDEARRVTKSEMEFYEHLVDRCRVRLFSEFEKWYAKTFLCTEG